LTFWTIHCEEVVACSPGTEDVLATKCCVLFGVDFSSETLGLFIIILPTLLGGFLVLPPALFPVYVFVFSASEIGFLTLQNFPEELAKFSFNTTVFLPEDHVQSLSH